VLAWVIAVIAVSCVAQVGLALPDLAVARLEVHPSVPVAGTRVALSATIENLGPSGTEGPFFVRFLVDGREIDVLPVGSLPGGQTEQLRTSWTALAGRHVLCVEVDGPFSRVEESDERNNAGSLEIDVRLEEDLMAALAPLKVAIARFDDVTGTGFVNVGEGVADELVDRFTAVGLRVVDRIQLDAAMQENGLNPRRREDVTAAAELLGADLLLFGTVIGIHVRQASLSLGFVRLDSASADVELAAEILDVPTAHPLASVSGEGRHEGATGFSIDLGQLLSSLTEGSSEVCTGGLQSDHPWYNVGRTVLLGYRNEGQASWFGIEIYASGGTLLRWMGWKPIDAGGCASWSWDQSDAAGQPVSPGIYTAKLWDGTSYVATVSLQIRPGLSLSTPTVDEVTVGSPRFHETVVGVAMGQAIDSLTSALLVSMADVALREMAWEAAPRAMLTEPVAAPLEGQIAAILPDGRIVVNRGTASGVSVGDAFEVLEVTDLALDSQTGEILDYRVVRVKGRIEVIEAREKVSYAFGVGAFVPVIGDVVRSVP